MTINEVIRIHDLSIRKFGGRNGVRDYGLLESALHRPYSTFDGNELYPSIVEKASAIVHSLVGNHPFNDGNKRIGYILMRRLLLMNNLNINASQEEKYDFVIGIAEGTLNYDDIKNWINRHLVEVVLDID